MRTMLTAKLKLTLTPTQFAALRATQVSYRDALNLVSAYAFAHGKTSSRRRLQEATYSQIRVQFQAYPLPGEWVPDICVHKQRKGVVRSGMPPTTK